MDKIKSNDKGNTTWKLHGLIIYNYTTVHYTAGSYYVLIFAPPYLSVYFA